MVTTLKEGGMGQSVDGLGTPQPTLVIGKVQSHWVQDKEGPKKRGKERFQRTKIKKE